MNLVIVRLRGTMNLGLVVSGKGMPACIRSAVCVKQKYKLIVSFQVDAVKWLVAAVNVVKQNRSNDDIKVPWHPSML